jgi:hypothetical protein
VVVRNQAFWGYIVCTNLCTSFIHILPLLCTKSYVHPFSPVKK